MTTAICFDLDGTLVQYTCSSEEIVRDVFDVHDIEPTDSIVEQSVETFWTALDGMESSPYRQAMEAAVEAADSDADPDKMVETLRETEYAATTVPDDAHESLAGLGEDDPLAVITNGVREWQVGKLEYHGLTDSFEEIVASYEAGANKPDPAPFELLRERLPSDEYVMVGDDYEADVEGSRAAGFVPIHYENDDEGPDLWATLGALL